MVVEVGADSRVGEKVAAGSGSEVRRRSAGNASPGVDPAELLKEEKSQKELR